MTFRRDLFRILLESNSAVKVADDRCIDALEIGTAVVQEMLNGVLYECQIKDVVRAGPWLQCNIYWSSISHESFHFCEGCEMCKQAQRSYPSSVSVGNYEIGEIIYRDVTGP